MKPQVKLSEKQFQQLARIISYAYTEHKRKEEEARKKEKAG